MRTAEPTRKRAASGTRELDRADAQRHRPGDLGIEERHGADEIRDECGRGLAINVLRRADLLDHALVHHHDAVGHRERFFLVVRHHDGGHAEPALQRLDLVAQAQPHARIERGERLVEQQQAGRGRERARERDALLLAAGELHRIFLALLRQADQRQQFGDARLDRDARLALIDEAVADIRRDTQVRKQRVGLEHDAEIARGRRQVRDVAPGDLDHALVLRIEAGDRAQQRGLAAAGRPEEADEVALLHVERDVLERGELAEAFRQVADAQKRRGRRADAGRLD